MPAISCDEREGRINLLCGSCRRWTCVFAHRYLHPDRHCALCSSPFYSPRRPEVWDAVHVACQVGVATREIALLFGLGVR